LGKAKSDKINRRITISDDFDDSWSLKCDHTNDINCDYFNLLIESNFHTFLLQTLGKEFVASSNARLNAENEFVLSRQHL